MVEERRPVEQQREEETRQFEGVRQRDDSKETHVSNTGYPLAQIKEPSSKEEPSEVEFASNLDPALHVLHHVEHLLLERSRSRRFVVLRRRWPTWNLRPQSMKEQSEEWRGEDGEEEGEESTLQSEREAGGRARVGQRLERRGKERVEAQNSPAEMDSVLIRPSEAECRRTPRRGFACLREGQGEGGEKRRRR